MNDSKILKLTMKLPRIINNIEVYFI